MYALVLAIVLPLADGGRPAGFGWVMPPLRGGSDDRHAVTSSNTSLSAELGIASSMPSSAGPRAIPSTWLKPGGRQGGVGCHEPTCSKVAKYGPKGSTMVLSCTEHKLNGWVDLRNRR